MIDTSIVRVHHSRVLAQAKSWPFGFALTATLKADIERASASATPARAGAKSESSVRVVR